MSALRALLPLFERERAAARPLTLATVVRTDGPTYTKAGALMLIAQSGEYAGLLSGGCLEGDLAEHARAVLEEGQARVVRYDMLGPNDLLFGLGSGCEGSMDILLQRLDAPGAWQPMSRLESAWRARRREGVLLVVRSEDCSLPAGSGAFASDAAPFGGAAPGAVAPLVQLARKQAHSGSSRFLPQAMTGVDALALTEVPPPRIIVAGAGPDARPVAELASFLGWSIAVIDHRPQYAQPQLFPRAECVLDGGPAALERLLRSGASHADRFAAAIVMSHHYFTDSKYLALLAATEIPYIGLLGPVARRERLLEQLGAQAAALRKRLRSPVGLDLGADTPEAIALAIVAEIHGMLKGRDCTALTPPTARQPLSAPAAKPSMPHTAAR
ncbi:MAG TPA: XdhC family protein [Steroidobacteraceae bacterium]